MLIIKQCYFRQPSNPTQQVILYEDSGMWTVEHRVIQHQFLDGETYVIADQTFGQCSAADEMFTYLREHFSMMADWVGNEVDIDTGKELPED